MQSLQQRKAILNDLSGAVARPRIVPLYDRRFTDTSTGYTVRVQLGDLSLLRAMKIALERRGTQAQVHFRLQPPSGSQTVGIPTLCARISTVRDLEPVLHGLGISIREVRA